MVPSSARNAIDSGSSVLRIQKQWPAFCSNTNSMPEFGAIDFRYIRPCSRAAGVAATSAWIAYMPAVSGATGSAPWALATPAASAASSRQQREVRIFDNRGMMVSPGRLGVGQPQA